MRRGYPRSGIVEPVDPITLIVVIAVGIAVLIGALAVGLVRGRGPKQLPPAAPRPGHRLRARGR